MIEGQSAKGKANKCALLKVEQASQSCKIDGSGIKFLRFWRVNKMTRFKAVSEIHFDIIETTNTRGFIMLEVLKNKRNHQIRKGSLKRKKGR